MGVSSFTVSSCSYMRTSRLNVMSLTLGCQIREVLMTVGCPTNPQSVELTGCRGARGQRCCEWFKSGASAVMTICRLALLGWRRDRKYSRRTLRSSYERMKNPDELCARARVGPT